VRSHGPLLQLMLLCVEGGRILILETMRFHGLILQVKVLCAASGRILISATLVGDDTMCHR